MVPDLVHKLKFVLLRETYVIQRKPNEGQMNVQTRV